MKKPAVLVRRSAARGDVLLSATLAPILKEKYERVEYITRPACAEVLRKNPFIDTVHNSESVLANSAVDFIDLDLAYEKCPHMHIVEAYAEAAGFTDEEKARLRKFAPFLFAQRIFEKYDVVLHPALSWPNRTFPIKFWADLLQKLSAQFRVLVIGSETDMPSLQCPPGVVDSRGRFSIAECASEIENAGVFIGNDSLMVHVAAATRAPIVGLYTCAEARFRYPWRPAGVFVPIEAAVSCYGCLHREAPPVTFCDCPAGNNYACVSSITADKVFEKATEILRGYTW